MATRPGFYERNGKVRRRNADFVWNSGFAVCQKQKNIDNLHKALGGRCLEVSTKSRNELGRALSAHNLRLDGYVLENVYQSSKVFEKGGPYPDLLQIPAKAVKRDERLHCSGVLVGFQYEEHIFGLNPKHGFYDYIYCKAVRQCINAGQLQELLQFDYFTDIEFNPNKGISTQAEAIVVVKILLLRFGKIPDFTPEEFLDFYTQCI